MIEEGLADARHDSRDGYGSHPREAHDVAADNAYPDCMCSRPNPAPPLEPESEPSGSCDPSYPTVCIPPSPPDLDGGDISCRRFTVLAPDPHRFDGDHDGIGCESG